MSTDFAVIFMGTFAAMGLWWLFIGSYRSYRIDLLRQRLFEARDGLFDNAVDGDIPFDSPAYGMTRTTINGMIRFAHELSLFRLFSLVFMEKYLLHDRDANEYRSKLSKAIEALSDDQKEYVQQAQILMGLAVISHLLHTSVILAPILFFLKAVITVARIALTPFHMVKYASGMYMRGIESINGKVQNLDLRWDIESRAYGLGQDEATQT